MERFSFGDDVAFVPRGDLLDGVTIAPLTQPTEEGPPSERAPSAGHLARGWVPRPQPLALGHKAVPRN